DDARPDRDRPSPRSMVRGARAEHRVLAVTGPGSPSALPDAGGGPTHEPERAGGEAPPACHRIPSRIASPEPTHRRRLITSTVWACRPIPAGFWGLVTSRVTDFAPLLHPHSG